MLCEFSLLYCMNISPGAEAQQTFCGVGCYSLLQSGTAAGGRTQHSPFLVVSVVNQK